MKITVLGAHSSETVTARCTSFLVDGRLAIDAGALTSSLTLEQQKRLDYVLLTHAHFDHIKDIPLLALNSYRMKARVKVFSNQIVLDNIQDHLLNGSVYPQFQELPEANPTITFHRITPLRERRIGGYKVLAVPVKHTESSLAYRVEDAAGKSFCYTSDTGAGLRGLWEKLEVDLLFVEATIPEEYEDYARRTHHLTPGLLYKELKALRELKGRLPRIVVVHRDPLLQDMVAQELTEVAGKLKITITIAEEGMEFDL